MQKNVSAWVLAAAVAFPAGAPGAEKTTEKPPAKPAAALGTGLSPAALIAAGVAAAAAALAAAGGGGSSDGDSSHQSAGGGTGGSAGGASESAAPPSTRTLSYTSAGDFQTSEFAAQQGLQAVKADRLYYNGHYRWYVGDAPDPAAGTGIGVKIAVADTGINPVEGSSGGAIALDVAASYDYMANRAGSGADDYGHGTHVAGLIAAPKNGTGMHGLAYNATIVNFKVGTETISATDSQLGNMFTRAANAGAMIVNNSWGSRNAITAVSAEQLQSSMPRMIEAARSYVGRGGVVVFAAGNEGAAQPSLQAGLPHRIAGLESGWIAVVAVDESNRIATYSNRCGVAAAWCLAAPGGAPWSGLYSMQNNGGYAYMYGTSMAAPHASAALAALKSMFPNLSYHQVRERLLFTANRSGAYADAAAYGQGLMDLEAASSPVGGVSVPTESSANGTTAPVAGSGIEFQPGALGALRMQGWVMVLDNYQRAPFWMPAQAFFREAAPRLLERQWASLRSAAPRRVHKPGESIRLTHTPGLNTAFSADLSSYRLGFSKGTGGEALLGAQLELAWIPRLAAPGSDSVALGYASDYGGLRIGLLGTLPAAQAAAERTLESSSLGGRKALGVIAQHREAATTYGVSLAMAEDFERPIGIATSGAFGVEDSAAFSSGAFVRHALGARTVLDASFELAHHRAEAGGMLAAPGYAVRSASLGAATRFGRSTTFSAAFRREWSGGGAARLQVPSTIAENGDIGRVTYALPYDELLGRSTFTLRLDQPLAKHADLRVALTRERQGFGATVQGIAALVEISH